MARKGTKTTEQFRQEMLLVNPDIEVLGEYITNSIKILVKNKRCGHEWDSAIPSRLLAGSNCPECAKYKRWDNRFIDKTGETNINKWGTKMTIIKYNNKDDITVEFEDGVIIDHTYYSVFKSGQLLSPYDKTVFGIGYLGEGKYTSTIDNKKSPQYYAWTAMIKRCYDPKQQEKQPTYKNCIVCEDWHNFQNYAKWWNENYYEIEGQRMELDKDILHKGNKIYSPENCVFVPNNINALIINCKKARGKYPIGVYRIESGKFRSTYSDSTLGRKVVHLGCFDTPKKAFEVYKIHKEKHIKEIADYYKEQIPENLYNALYNWKIEITD